jgi:hypothetical protein
MNNAHTPPGIPPQVPPLAAPGIPPLGADPADQTPISSVLTAAEAILRHPRRVMFQLQQENARLIVAALLMIAVLCSLAYGVIAGTFSGGEQLWAAPVKIAAGLILSGLICLPSLYIFSCLGGSQARLVEVTGMIAGLLALMSVLLIGFAPVVWVFSQSTESLAAMGALHLGFWLVALGFGVRFLLAGFRHLNSDSGSGLKLWILIFVLVALQMTTALRPIVGTADTFLPVEKKFFLSHWMDSLEKTKTPVTQSFYESRTYSETEN